MIAGVVLAAGASSRMGRDKALLLFRDRTFLDTIIDTLFQVGIERVVVVLGHHADEIRQATNLSGVEVRINMQYRSGQTSSVQEGLRALEGSDAEGVVLCLVDHPASRPETVGALIGAFQESGAPVVIPTYEDRRGHPVLIGRALFPELLALSTQEGANTVVQRYRDVTRLVEVDDPGVLVDVDDPEAYRRLQAAG